MNALFLIVAFVCFILAAAGIAANVNLVALGLAFWVLAILVPVAGTVVVNQSLLLGGLIVLAVIVLAVGLARMLRKP